MTPKFQALIEAVGVWREAYYNGTQDQESRARLELAPTYDALMASLATPPSALPPAPKGKRWVRVEYPNSWADSQSEDCLVYLLGQKTLTYTRFDYTRYTQGLAQVLRYGWRLEDDPQADSLEKIADEIEASGVGGNMAQRIRALIGEGQK